MKPDQPNKKSSTPDQCNSQGKDQPKDLSNGTDAGPWAETAEFDESNDLGASAPANSLRPDAPTLDVGAEELVGTGGATATFRSGNKGEPASEASHPSHVGRYEIRKLIGSGAYGAVYRGWDPRLKRDVAIKLPRFRDEDQANQFVEEAQRAVQLRRHAGIVPVYDVGSEGELAYIVSEFIEGGSLADRQKTQPLTIEETLATLRTLADIVSFAHSQGWVHRDIKPSNVLVDDTKQPYLTDFGLTKRLDAEEGEEFLYGTPNYMAPELVADVYAQMKAKPRPNNVADERVDIYALGVMLYEFLSSRTPFQGGDLPELFENVLHETLLPPSEYNSDVSPQLDAICMKALARDPANRFLTADDLHNELQAELASVQAGEIQLAGGSPMRTGVVFVASALLIGLIAVVVLTVGNSLWKGPQQEVEGNKKIGDKSIAMNDPVEQTDEKMHLKDDRSGELEDSDKPANEHVEAVAADQPEKNPLSAATTRIATDGRAFNHQPNLGVRVHQGEMASPGGIHQGNYRPGGVPRPNGNPVYGHAANRSPGSGFSTPSFPDPGFSGSSFPGTDDSFGDPKALPQAYPNPPSEGRIWSTLQTQVASGNIDTAKLMLQQFKAETPPKGPAQPTIERWEKYLEAIVIEDEPPSP